MSTTACKFHIKLGSAEFDGEGPEDIVKEQLGYFYIAATQLPPPRLNGNGHGQNGNGTTHVNGNGNGDGAEPALLSYAAPDLDLRTDVDPKIISRLFREEEGAVILRALPKTEERNGDALLLILWGHYVLKNQLEVSGKQLTVCVKRSGINLQRVDETLAKKAVHSYIATGGAGRNKCYSLNNSGLTYAASLAKQIFA